MVSIKNNDTQLNSGRTKGNFYNGAVNNMVSGKWVATKRLNRLDVWKKVVLEFKLRSV